MKSLDNYSRLPEDMVAYIEQYGFHFNKKACDYACKMMKSKKKYAMMEKNEVEELLQKNGIRLEKNKLYDFVFVANMAKSDFWLSSIADEQHLALFIKDYIDDEDASDETAFRRWLATLVGNGEPIEWADLL